MADFIGKTKGFGDESDSILFNTYVPELEDDANIQNAFELFYFGDSSAGSEYDEVDSIYAHFLNFDSRITSNTSTVNGLVSTIGSGNLVVGTGTSQTLTNKAINLLNNTLSGTVAQFNIALSDADFSTIAGTETLTNKTLTSPKINENVALTATATELNYVDGVTSAIQTQLDYKSPSASPTFTGTVVLPSNTSIGTVSATEIGYVDGVTSSIQTQINLKPTLTYEGVAVGRNIFVQAAQPTAANIGDIWLDF
jgi:hypothetical protein